MTSPSHQGRLAKKRKNALGVLCDKKMYLNLEGKICVVVVRANINDDDMKMIRWMWSYCHDQK